MAEMVVRGGGRRGGSLSYTGDGGWRSMRAGSAIRQTG